MLTAMTENIRERKLEVVNPNVYMQKFLIETYGVKFARLVDEIARLCGGLPTRIPLNLIFQQLNLRTYLATTTYICTCFSLTRVFEPI